MSNLLELLLEETQENEDIDSSEFTIATVNHNQTSAMPEDCRLEVWQCMSGVLETGIRYVETPRDMYR